MSETTIFILGFLVFGIALAGTMVSIISGSEKGND